MIVKFKDDHLSDMQEFYAEVDREIQSMMKESDEMKSKRPPPGYCSSTETPDKNEPEAHVAWWHCMIPPKRKDRWDLAGVAAMVLLLSGGYLALLVHYFTNPADNVMVLLACMFGAPFAIPLAFISVGCMIDGLTKSMRDNRQLAHGEQQELQESERQEREEMLR